MNIIQHGYQLTTGVAKGSWNASLPLGSLRFSPFYYAVSGSPKHVVLKNFLA